MTTDTPPLARPSWLDPWPWMLGLLALGLRVLDLGHRLLWSDEAATWYFGRLIGEGRLGEAILYEPTPPLFYALAGWSERLFGPGDVALRLPSVVFGTLGAVAAWWLGRRLFGTVHGPVAGQVSGLLVAIHPLLVLYGREARVYPLLALEVLVLVGVLSRALDSPDGGSIRSWAAVAGLGALVCYSHFYGLFVLGAIGLASLILGRSGRAKLRGCAAAMVAGLAFAPYVLATLPSLRRSGADWSVAMIYELLPGERSPLRVLEGQAVGALRTLFSRHLARPASPPFVRWPALAIQVGLLAAAVAPSLRLALERFRWRANPAAESGIRSSPESVREARSVAMLAIFWIAPIAVPWTITHVFGRPIFHSGRHDAFVVPLACVLLGYGASRLWHGGAGVAVRRLRRAIVVVALGALLLASALRIVLLHTAPEDRRVLEIAEVLTTQTEPGDRVVAFGIRRLVTERYTRLAAGARSPDRTRSADPAVPIVSFPASTDQHPGWADLVVLGEDVPALEREAAERVAGWTRDGGRVFLLTRFPGTREKPRRSIVVDGPLIRALAAAGWTRAGRWPALEVEVWERAEVERP